MSYQLRINHQCHFDIDAPLLDLRSPLAFYTHNSAVALANALHVQGFPITSL